MGNWHDDTDRQRPYLISVADAVAELCRMGVLRPGPVIVDGGRIGGTIDGGFALTALGRKWIAARPESVPRDPSRFMDVIAGPGRRFGPGFMQRAEEAIGCYRAGRYLAACVMCGAAAEAILLALAIAKTGDEDAVLRDYRSAQGRKKMTDLIGSRLKGSLREPLESFVGLLAVWRDEAGHGRATAITDAEADTCRVQLLRFALFADAEWDALTAPTGSP